VERSPRFSYRGLRPQACRREARGLRPSAARRARHALIRLVTPPGDRRGPTGPFLCSCLVIALRSGTIRLSRLPVRPCPLRLAVLVEKLGQALVHVRRTTSARGRAQMGMLGVLVRLLDAFPCFGRLRRRRSPRRAIQELPVPRSQLLDPRGDLLEAPARPRTQAVTIGAIPAGRFERACPPPQDRSGYYVGQRPGTRPSTASRSGVCRSVAGSAPHRTRPEAGERHQR
jgi:hypothetical protein